MALRRVCCVERKRMPKYYLIVLTGQLSIIVFNCAMANFYIIVISSYGSNSYNDFSGQKSLGEHLNNFAISFRCLQL